MASIGWEGKRARILFRDEQGKQQSIRLGECPKDYARSAKMAIGHLVIAKRHNGVPHADAVRWLGGIDEVLYARVVAHGLCQPRQDAAVVTLANLLDRFDATGAVKPTTKYKYRQVADSLRAFLGADAPLASITRRPTPTTGASRSPSRRRTPTTRPSRPRRRPAPRSPSAL
ncbi:MAG: hypothetical protein ACK54T_01110 [bacterium]